MNKETGFKLLTLLNFLLQDARHIDLSSYDERIKLAMELCDKIEEDSDWLSLPTGTTFTKTFTPSNRNYPKQ